MDVQYQYLRQIKRYIDYINLEDSAKKEFEVI